MQRRNVEQQILNKPKQNGYLTEKVKGPYGEGNKSYGKDNFLIKSWKQKVREDKRIKEQRRNIQ